MRICSDRNVSVFVDRKSDIAFISTFGILLVLYLWNGILTLLPSSAVSGLVGVLVILTIVAFYIFHMTSNLMLAGGLEVIGVAAAVIAYFVKSSLFENLLSKCLEDWHCRMYLQISHPTVL